MTESPWPLRVLTETWHILADSSPYLLFGFLVAGVLHGFVSADAVARHLQRRGLAWHTLVDPQGRLSQGLGFAAVPGFAVLTPDGRLRWATVGLTSGWGMRLRLWLG